MNGPDVELPAGVGSREHGVASSREHGVAAQVAAAPGDSWADTYFVRVFLPDRETAFASSGNAPPPARSLREALNAAYDLAVYLPLPISALYQADAARQLQQPGAVLVTVERIDRVADHNRKYRSRIDIVCYMNNGDVSRFHPGSTRKSSAEPATMPRGSPLYAYDIAAKSGVGSALHLHPPGIANVPRDAQHNAGLCSQQHRRLIKHYDSESWNWKRLYRSLKDNMNPAMDVECNDVPWWLWLSSSGSVQDSIADNVERAVCRVIDKEPTLVIITAVHEYVVMNQSGKPRCTPSRRPEPHA